VAAKFVLASASPRRHQLLAEAGFLFDVAHPTVSESESAVLTIRELTICNAARKAIAVARTRPDAVVLGADTLVALGRSVIGKPRDLADARRFLRRLRGREHQVCTSVFICSCGDDRVASFSVTTQVRFRPLTDDEIAARIQAKKFGVGVGTFDDPVVSTPATTVCTNCRDLSVTFHMPMNFLFFSAPSINITRTKRVYLAS